MNRAPHRREKSARRSHEANAMRTSGRAASAPTTAKDGRRRCVSPQRLVKPAAGYLAQDRGDGYGARPDPSTNCQNLLPETPNRHKVGVNRSQYGECRMRRLALFFGVAIVLGGCAHNLTIVNRQTGEVGTASATGNRNGDIHIMIGGKTYSGTWVYMTNGGAVGFSSGTAISGIATASAFGTMSTMPTGGGGTILASAADGSTLRCEFQYNQIGSTGVGVCQDSHGGLYDLQIH